MCAATGESRWSAEQLDHGDEPLRHDKEVDDLVDGLQLRRIRSFLHPVTKAPVVAHNGRVNNSVERETVLLVHTRQDAEHLGLPTTQGNISRSVKTSKPSLAHATAGVDGERISPQNTVLLVMPATMSDPGFPDCRAGYRSAPKISCSPCPSRSLVPEPQSAEQLVEVPTVLSPTRIALQIAEQIVGIPAPRGRVQGFLPQQSSTATTSYLERISERTVEQIVDFPSSGGGLG